MEKVEGRGKREERKEGFRDWPQHQNNRKKSKA